MERGRISSSTAEGKICDDDPALKTQGRKSRIIQALGAVLRL